nr:Dihydrofolate reductase [uncultured bacterium]
MKLPHISMSCAMTECGVIGNKGKMPWRRLGRDLRRFRELTENTAVVMGPKTYASLPEKYRPLPRRLNIILTTNQNYKAPEGVLIAHDPRQVLELAAIEGYVELFVIGGAMIYTSFLPIAEHLFITYVKSRAKGDTHFPHWEKSRWREVWVESAYRKDKGDSYPTRFAEYRRMQKPLPQCNQVSWRHPDDARFEAALAKKKRNRKKQKRPRAK